MQDSKKTNSGGSRKVTELPRGTSIQEFFEYVKSRPGKVRSITINGKKIPVGEDDPLNRGK